MPTKHPYILLIDDDQDDLDLLSALLEKSGVVTKAYNSGVKAQIYLRLLSDCSILPALIIVDYNMPRQNGQQVLTALKSDRYTQDIPIIVYSTLMSAILKVDLMKLGAYDCLTKPGKVEELADQVSMFIRLAYSSGLNKHVA